MNDRILMNFYNRSNLVLLIFNVRVGASRIILHFVIKMLNFIQSYTKNWYSNISFF